MTPSPEPVWSRWARRAVTVPLYLLLAPTWMVALVGILPLVVALDLVRRRPLPLARACLALAHYFVCEAVGIAASFVLSIARIGASSERFVAWNYRLQARWAGSLFAGARALYRLRLEVDGDDIDARRPVIVFMRHASLADTLLPVVALSARRRLRLRYVMKRELLWDPCLDIVGHRLPNVFVHRRSGHAAQEIASVRRLAEGLVPGEGVLIYPEGTRFSPAKRDRAIAELEARGDRALAARARALRHVLPPRPGGALALLDSCAASPPADVVFLAHVGLDGIASAGDFLRGALVGRRLCVHLRRVPAEHVPAAEEARVLWLYDEWARVDAWVAEQRRALGLDPAAAALEDEVRAWSA